MVWPVFGSIATAGKAFGKIIKIENGEHQWTDPLSGSNFIQLKMKMIFPIQKREGAHDVELQYQDDQTGSIVLQTAEDVTPRVNVM